MISEIVAAQVWVWLLVFTRVGAAFTVMPIFGDPFMPARVRLILALALSVLIGPTISASLPKMPASAFEFAGLEASEIVIGIFIGTVGRLMFSALDTAGMIIALQSSLSNAAVFNPALASQESLPGAFMSSLAMLLVFVTDLHHLLLMAIADSYTFFVPGKPVPVGDFADVVSHLVSSSFLVGVEMTAPFLISGLVVSLAMGLLSRLAPQIQVFYVFMSGQVAFGLFLLMITLSAMMLFWLKHFQDEMLRFVTP